jgi:hypothetical protein
MSLRSDLKDFLYRHWNRLPRCLHMLSEAVLTSHSLSSVGVAWMGEYCWRQKTRLHCDVMARYCTYNIKKTSLKSNEPIKFCVSSKIELFKDTYKSTMTSCGMKLTISKQQNFRNLNIGWKYKIILYWFLLCLKSSLPYIIAKKANMQSTYLHHTQSNGILFVRVHVCF